MVHRHPGEVEAQLARILASPLFAQSPRLSAFLRYVVRAAQAGESDSVKEYSIGVEVFERGADFDPRIDNIVRVQAAKVRSKLVEYYASPEGAADPIVIGIPKGSYAPEIAARAKAVAAAPAPGRSRIAVLPFVNMSSDPENEYFSDGLTEELINRLASIPSLQVVARTSAFAFKGRNEDLREVGAKLNVGTVLEGSVRRFGDSLRITAQLIDVESGYHLFSRSYQREFKNIFELQDELAREVAGEIAPESRPTSAAPTRALNLDAYNAYLRGMYALANRFNDIDTSVACFREALALEPEYAPAWAGLAHGYFMVAWFYLAHPDHVMPLAREAALRTLTIDPDSASGLGSLGVIECGCEWQWEKGEARFRRAIKLQPSLAMPYMHYAFCCLLPQSRSAEACEVLERALIVDPFNLLLHAGAIYAYGHARRHSDAMRQFAVARSIGADYAPIHGASGAANEWNGHLDGAIANYRRAAELSRNAPYAVSCLGHALAVTGGTEEARGCLRLLLDKAAPAEADVARVYLGLRETDEALHWLEAAVSRRSIYMMRVVGDPRSDALLDHSRYQAILRTMRLAAPPEASSGQAG